MNETDEETISFSSPDHGIMRVPAGTIKKDSVYDKLGELSGSIEDGIRTTSSEAR